MKKFYFFKAAVLMIIVASFAMSFESASAVGDILYDFGEKNGACSWTTSIPSSKLEPDCWTGITDRANNIIELKTSSSPISGKDYPYFVLRVRYTIPEGESKTPNTFAYFETVDENGEKTNSLWSGGVSQNINMDSSDNGKFVTYFFDMSSNSIYNSSYITHTAVGVGNGYSSGGVLVEMDFAAFVTDKYAAITFENPADPSIALPEPVNAELGSSLSLDDFTAYAPDNALVGWSLYPGSTETVDAIECVKDDTVLYAVWETAETVDITYHSCADGAGVSGITDGETKSLAVGSAIYSSVSPKRSDGLIFYGWSESEGSRELLPYDAVAYTDADLYAVWGEGLEWSFDSDGSLAEISSYDQLSQASVSGGVFSAVTSGADPKITLRFSAPIDRLNKLIIVMNAEVPEGSSSISVQVFAGLDSLSLSESRSLIGFLYPESVSLEYDIYNSIPDAPSSYELTQLRIDPGNSVGVPLEIDRILLVPDVESAAIFDKDGAEGKVRRVLPDSDRFVTLPESTLVHSYKIFDGWTDGENTYQPGDKVKISGIVTFKPNWDEGAVKDLDTQYYPGFTKKALIFSYDDGYEPGDTGLIQRLNSFGYRATFNIISSHWDSFSEEKLDEKRALYAGHEIANHSDTHPEMHSINPETGGYVYTADECIENIDAAKEKLERVFGYGISGFAWPYTCPSARTVVLEHVRDNYIYARGSGMNGFFDVPSSFDDNWTFTVYQAKYQGILGEYAEKYKNYQSDGLSLFSVWGHSFEFINGNPSFDEFEEFLGICGTIDLWNPTCAEYVRYVKAQRELVVNAECVYNPTDLTLYAKSGETELILPPESRYDGNELTVPSAVITESGVHISAPADLRDASSPDAVAVCAVYDADGRLLGAKFAEAQSGHIDIVEQTVGVSSGADPVYAKIFAFDGEASLKPVCEPVYIDIVHAS